MSATDRAREVTWFVTLCGSKNHAVRRREGIYWISFCGITEFATQRHANGPKCKRCLSALDRATGGGA